MSWLMSRSTAIWDMRAANAGSPSMGTFKDSIAKHSCAYRKASLQASRHREESRMTYPSFCTSVACSMSPVAGSAPAITHMSQTVSSSPSPTAIASCPTPAITRHGYYKGFDISLWHTSWESCDLGVSKINICGLNCTCKMLVTWF